MADLAAIFSVVSWGSKLALEIYKFATRTLHASNDLSLVAKSISNFSLTIKQLGANIKDNDRFPSPEAVETIEDVLEQCKAVFREIETIVPVRDAHCQGQNASYFSQSRSFRPSPESRARLEYLKMHLDSLKSTLSVMLQSFHTAQSIMWARTRPTVSPQKAARAVANEKTQLETLIIEQQISLLSASKQYEESRDTTNTPDPLRLMEKDSSKSLVAIEEKDDTLKPSNLFRYQESSLASLDPSYTEIEWFSAVCEVSASHMDNLLERWTRLRELRARINDEERKVEARRRENFQPTVESDDSDDQIGSLPNLRNNRPRLATPAPRRPPSIQPLFTESNTLPIPVPDSKFSPTAPLSPASSFGASPRSSISSLPSPQSPHANISTLPVEAAAAVEAKDEDEEADLEIPWRLCSRGLYWEYIDGRIKKSNTDAPSSSAFTDKTSWTEILASWVCKEAIKEAGYKYTQVQKERQGGRRTKFEAGFCIQRPLTFADIHRLVERTVEIYRQNLPPTPPPSNRRSPFYRVTSLRAPPSHDRDRDRTPLANQHPPLERSTSLPFPPPPPPLDRSLSLPGTIPTYTPFPHPTQNPHTSTTHPPSLPSPYSPQAAQKALQNGPYSPQAAPYSPQGSYSPGATSYSPSLYPSLPDQRRLSNSNTYPQSPLRQSYSSTQHGSTYSSTSTTDESDSATRSRRHRSKSRRSSHGSTSSKKGGHKTVGTLATVGGLAALLDGIVDLGVL
ncbi:hypothetical protein K469DRAFT_577355 [Zopfia rhizophila CBS 207.26]|uniref:DUF8035 domain-containing protein n=1 Tax=Zopfia rhizophila CBS 207.26 TaxID=1314779 RepID=A0A6A6DZD0_9PEZI|nr:hypothetical protein K469DRAFT_577355 [Zopfia rhizophila CBS 207.26]